MPGQRNGLAPALSDAVLDELRTGLGPAGDRVLAQVVALFLDGVPATMNALRSAAETHDRDGLARAAHRLRGDAAIIGAGSLESLCAEAESLGWAGALAAASDLIDSIGSEVSRVESALHHRLGASAQR